MGAGFNRNKNEGCVLNVCGFFAAFLGLELGREDPWVERWPNTGRAESIPVQSQRRLTARTRIEKHALFSRLEWWPGICFV